MTRTIKRTKQFKRDLKRYRHDVDLIAALTQVIADLAADIPHRLNPGIGAATSASITSAEGPRVMSRSGGNAIALPDAASRSHSAALRIFRPKTRSTFAISAFLSGSGSPSNVGGKSACSIQRTVFSYSSAAEL